MSEGKVPGKPQTADEEVVSQSQSSHGKRQSSSLYDDIESGECDSDSEGGQRESTRPPSKRARVYSQSGIYDPRVDALISHVGKLTDYLQRCAPSCSTVTPSLRASTSASEFLVKPSVGNLVFGEFQTLTDNSKVIKNAPQNRVDSLMKLQRFNTNGWKDVKYSKALQSFLARPGFVELKINDELCHLNKGKDYLATTERTMAGLTNGLLEHKDIMRNNLQEIINWATNSPSELSPANLFDKIMTLFGPSSQNYKNMEQILQVVCGKRAESVEIRRERVISEISNKNLQNTLRRLPPSAEHLFDHSTLMPVIQSLGGTSAWLNTPSYLTENKPVSKKCPYEQSATPIQTNSLTPAFHPNKKRKYPKKKKDGKNGYNRVYLSEGGGHPFIQKSTPF